MAPGSARRQWRNGPAAYGLSRVVVGFALLAAPRRIGHFVVGDAAPERDVRDLLRLFGVRDGVLGLGLLRSVERQNAATWLAASFTSDLADALVFAARYRRNRRRLDGLLVATAVAGAVTGYVLYRRNRRNDPQVVVQGAQRVAYGRS